MDVVTHFMLKNEQNPGKCAITSNEHITLIYSNYINTGPSFIIYPQCKATIIICNKVLKKHCEKECINIQNKNKKIVSFQLINKSMHNAIHVPSDISLLTLINYPEIKCVPCFVNKKLYKKCIK
jgi:hypothetical protein